MRALDAPGGRDVIGGRPVVTGVLPAPAVPAPAAPGGVAMGSRRGVGGADVVDWAKTRDRLQQAFTAGAGVVRSSTSLAAAERVLDDVQVSVTDGRDRVGATAPDGELVNLVTLGRALLRSAAARTESRGAHSRSDFPDTDPEWRRRLLHGGRAA
jgi:succinate dehydrogenase/fumarate reductase flavoprotein subunit